MPDRTPDPEELGAAHRALPGGVRPDGLPGGGLAAALEASGRAQGLGRPEQDRSPGDFSEKTLLGSFSASARLVLVLLLGLLGIAAFAVLLQIADSRLEPAGAEAAAAQVIAGEARGVESAVLALQSADKAYRLDAEVAQAEAYERAQRRLSERLTALFALPGTGQMEENISTLTEGLSQHVAEFRNYVSASEALGLRPEDGLIGLLSTSAQRVEAELDRVDVAALDAVMVDIRRLEATFLVFNRLKDLSAINRAFERFVAELERANIRAQTKQGITNLMKAYDTNLKAVAKARVAQAQAGERLDEVFAYLLPSAEGLSAFSLRAAEQALKAEARARGQVKLLLAGGAALILIVLSLAAILVLASFTRPLRKLAGAANALAAGRGGVSVPALGNADETGDIARALAVTRDHLEQRNDLVRELDQAKAALARHRDQAEQLRADLDQVDGDGVSDAGVGGADPAIVTKLQGELAGVRAQVLRREAEVKRLQNALDDEKNRSEEMLKNQSEQDSASLYIQQLERTKGELENARTEISRLRFELDDAKLETERAERALLGLRQAQIDQERSGRPTTPAEAQGEGGKAGPISAIGRDVASASATVSSAAEEAERTGIMIRGLVDADALIREVEQHLAAIAEQTNFLVFRQSAPWAGEGASHGGGGGGEMDETVGERFDSIRETTNRATRLLHGIDDTLGRVKAVALEIASDTSEQALQITTSLMEQSESLRGMLDDLVGSVKSGGKTGAEDVMSPPVALPEQGGRRG
ncbi:MAG: HAMP domain-containing protein [Magnetovibrionaceae bacterium]